jgi:hypothetical protein
MAKIRAGQANSKRAHHHPRTNYPNVNAKRKKKTGDGLANRLADDHGTDQRTQDENRCGEHVTEWLSLQ